MKGAGQGGRRPRRSRAVKSVKSVIRHPQIFGARLLSADPESRVGKTPAKAAEAKKKLEIENHRLHRLHRRHPNRSASAAAI